MVVHGGSLWLYMVVVYGGSLWLYMVAAQDGLPLLWYLFDETVFGNTFGLWYCLTIWQPLVNLHFVKICKFFLLPILLCTLLTIPDIWYLNNSRNLLIVHLCYSRLGCYIFWLLQENNTVAVVPLFCTLKKWKFYIFGN